MNLHEARREANRLSKTIEFHEVLGRADDVIRKVKEISKDEKLHVRVMLNGNMMLYVSHWTSWEDNVTGEKIVLFIGKDRSVLVELANINRIEFFYGKPEKISEEMKVVEGYKPRDVVEYEGRIPQKAE